MFIPCDPCICPYDAEEVSKEPGELDLPKRLQQACHVQPPAAGTPDL